MLTPSRRAEPRQRKNSAPSLASVAFLRVLGVLHAAACLRLKVRSTWASPRHSTRCLSLGREQKDGQFPVRRATPLNSRAQRAHCPWSCKTNAAGQSPAIRFNARCEAKRHIHDESTEPPSGTKAARNLSAIACVCCLPPCPRGAARRCVLGPQSTQHVGEPPPLNSVPSPGP